MNAYRHDVAIDGDFQIVRNVVSVFINQVVQRSNETVVHKLRKRRIGNNHAGIFSRVWR